MMSSSTKSLSVAEEVKKAANRRRSSKGKLRKRATLNGSIVVEEPIVFSLPNDSRNNNNKSYQETDNNSTIVGDGCYISCTVHRTRYYGILVDQDTLTAASDLYLKSEAESLDLNRRMKQLYHRQQQQQQQQQQQRAQLQAGLKRPRDDGEDSVTTAAARAVRPHVHQKLNSAQMTQLHNLKKMQKAQRVELQKHHRSQLALYGEKAQNDSSITISGRRQLEQLHAIEERHNKEKEDQAKLFREQAQILWESFRQQQSTDVLPPTEDQTIATAPTIAENGSAAFEGDTTVGANKAHADDAASENTHSFNNIHDDEKMTNHKQVQKFLFLPPDKSMPTDPGYRTLLATYTNVHAAAEDNQDKIKLISKACEGGGNFVGKYYYQFVESDNNTLTGTQSFESNRGTQSHNDIMIHTSLNLASFFQCCKLPPWYPLSNIDGFSKNKVLSMLKLKKKRENGEVEFDDPVGDNGELPIAEQTMNPVTDNSTNNGDNGATAERKVYRVGILGGGIAGLACAAELLRLAETDKSAQDDMAIKNMQVVLLEGRDRVGGRLHTDYETLDFPVDLGAGWIHGVDGNPITDLAKEAGITLVPTAEDVKLIAQNMQQISEDTDKKMSILFNNLLDQGMDQCWEHKELLHVDNTTRQQNVIRWYGSVLTDRGCGKDFKPLQPLATDVPIYRHSTDISVDHALGLVASLSLSQQEMRLLHWHTKNVEYALGADINSLSMKFWSADEDNAFEGEHVMLREGYSKVSELLLQRCLRRKNSFTLVLNFPIGMIEYSRKQTQLHHTQEKSKSRLFENTKACCVTSQDGKSSYEFDFLVCTLPLGVLKSSVDALPFSSDGIGLTNIASNSVTFNPALPMIKRDAIEAVGFGVLNKIYLQFPFAFWRKQGTKDSLKSTPFLCEEQQSFGNVSGVNPHIYMFYDVGMMMRRAPSGQKSNEPPAVLLTLVSGFEAVRMEQLPEEAVIKEVMVTLKSMYAMLEVPQPTCVKVTKWGSDKFSRGCYSFLPPGATNEDYTLLQLPLNGNGDKYSDHNFQVMRLFWAGEHTSSLHPSMAHGALLSGIRAAEEVICETKILTQKAESVVSLCDKPIPVTIYRSKNPLQPLACQLCNKIGSRKHEGALVSFQRGVKLGLVHLNCILYSSEVECVDDDWRNVFKAISRGRQIKCSKCRNSGASIGCNVRSCPLSYHFSCCEDEGWSFEHDGKSFFCKSHRESLELNNSTMNDSLCQKRTITLNSEMHPVDSVLHSPKGAAKQLIHHDLITDGSTSAALSNKK